MNEDIDSTVTGVMNKGIGSTLAGLMNEDIGSTVVGLMNEDIGSTVAGVMKEQKTINDQKTNNDQMTNNVLLFIFFCPLCCLFFFDLRILINPLVSSRSSCDDHTDVRKMKIRH